MSFFEPDNLRSVTGGQWLRRMTLPVVLDGVGIDSRDNLDGKLFVAVRGETHDGHAFLAQAVDAGAGLLMVERDMDCDSLPDGVGVIRVEDGRKALGRLALAYRRTLKGGKVIAVTGSSGKTTTKRLIDAVLSTAHAGTAAPKSFNNEIGVPLTILAARGMDKYVVVEIGTNAPGEVAQLAAITEPDLAVITTVGRSHLEGFGSVEAVAKEKCSLLPHLREGGTAIINADAPFVGDHLKPVESVLKFGESEEAELRLTGRGRSGDGWWVEVNDRQRFSLGLPGRHNAMNALAAVAVARRFGVNDEQISAALADVGPEPMRMTQEQVEVTGGQVRVFNDAYNANPDSVAAALETFAEVAADAERRIVVIGDMLELGEQAIELHREVGLKLIEIDQSASIDLLVLVGELASHVGDELGTTWGASRVVRFDTVDESAAELLVNLLKPGDVLLLKASRSVGLERLVEMLKRTPVSGAFA